MDQDNGTAVIETASPQRVAPYSDALAEAAYEIIARAEEHANQIVADAEREAFRILEDAASVAFRGEWAPVKPLPAPSRWRRVVTDLFALSAFAAAVALVAGIVTGHV